MNNTFIEKIKRLKGFKKSPVNLQILKENLLIALMFFCNIIVRLWKLITKLGVVCSKVFNKNSTKFKGLQKLINFIAVERTEKQIRKGKEDDLRKETKEVKETREIKRVINEPKKVIVTSEREGKIREKTPVDALPKKVTMQLSHWYKQFDGTQESPQKIYELVEDAIYKREISDTTCSRVFLKEGGIFSSNREYLRVTRGEHIFDICASHYGHGVFISWWLGVYVGVFWKIVLKIPYISEFLMNIFRPQTYFRTDTGLMFQESVRLAVLEVIDSITKSSGTRALSDQERKPIMSNFLKRRI